MIMPCTQVSCERAFSGLKFVKNRLRSSLGQEKLNFLMLMQQDRELTYKVDKNSILDNIANSSELMKKLLL
jgi:hypothetical protein